MDTIAQYLISKDDGRLQISYSEYQSLMEKLTEAEHIQKVKKQVLQNLQDFLAGNATSSEPDTGPFTHEDGKGEDRANQGRVEKSQRVSVEFAPADMQSTKKESTENVSKGVPMVPPLKKDIVEHFNTRDASGRLLNVFKQYYTCLNESCGGIVRVTMKDGILSLWNYDKWEEFAFVEIHEDELRFTLDSRYTDDLCSLDFCEVARLLAGRRNLIAIRVEDLNKTMLEVLTRAFAEVDLTAG